MPKRPSQIEVKKPKGSREGCSREGYQPISSTYFFGGRLAGFNNVLVADASVLPTSLGVSPQMTIMAFAHEILERHLAGGAQRPR